MVNIRKESCDVYIGRAGQGKDGYFGNPFRLEATMTRGGTLDRYRKYFYYRLSTDEKFRRRIGELQGKTLGCFCKPNPCHGDIIKEYLERMEGCTDEIAIEKTYWKGVAYPVREIQVGRRTGGCKVHLSPEELVERVSDTPEYKRYDYTCETFAEELCRLIFYREKEISGQHHK